MMKRITALLLCVLVLMSLLPVGIFAAEEKHVCDETCTHDNAVVEAPEAVDADADAENALTVSFQGKAVTSLAMTKYARSTLVAASDMRGRTGCRWQILADEESKLWVDIYGETENELTVSYAMVATLLDSENRVWVRCVHETESGERIGDPICITVLPPEETVDIREEALIKESVVEATEAPEQAPAEPATEPATEAATEPATEPATEVVTEPAIEMTEPPVVESTEAPTEIPVEMPTEAPAEAAVETEPAIVPATEPVAEATSATEPAAEETAPALTEEASNVGAMLTAEGDGVEEVLEDETAKKYILSIVYVFGSGDKAGKPAASTWSAEIGEKQPFKQTIKSPRIPGYAPDFSEHTFDYAEGVLTSDVQITVKYYPDFVNYTVNHLWQNVLDDEYTLHETTTHNDLKTEDMIPDNLDKVDGQPRYEGFEAMPYVKDEIAADGSTTVDIYYDRLYYLVSFNLDGGYGTLPVYARYGTQLRVKEPTKAGYRFGGWKESADDDAGIVDLTAATVPVGGKTYYAHWEPLNANYKVAYWIVNDDGTRSLLGTRIAQGETDDQVDGKDDLADSRVCGFEDDHIHDNQCYSCGYESHKHEKSCFSSITLSQNNPGLGAVAILDLETGFPESGYVYVIYSVDHGKYWPKLYLTDENGNGTYYVVNGVEGGTNMSSYSSIIEGDVNDWEDKVEGTYRDRTYNGASERLIVYKYKVKEYCSKKQHYHDDSELKVAHHGHTEKCYIETDHMDFKQTVTVTDKDGNKVTYETSQDEIIKGDGTTIVDVYYQYRTYTIRYVYARKSKNSNTFQIATLTGNGSLTGASWSGQYSAWPGVTDPNDDATPRYFESGNYYYYYIALTAKFGDSIASKWPSASIHGTVGDYEWGSWAAAPNTGYRLKYGDAHANIVGPFPVMSEDMIVKDPPIINDSSPESGTYLAQNMVAWWGSSTKISKHAYHNYFEVPAGEREDGDVFDEESGTYYRLDANRSFEFTAAHNGSTRVDPVQFEGYTVVNEKYYDQGDSEGFNNNGNCSICGTGANACRYCNTFYYKANSYKLTFWNHDDYLSDGSGAEVKNGELLKKRFQGITVDGVEYEGANALVQKPENYPDTLEPDAYSFEGWYTSSQFAAGTRVNQETMRMPAENIIVYARWVPNKYTVTILDEESGKVVKEFTDVPHGTTLGADKELPAPDKPAGHEDDEFVGWFFVDELGTEQAFSFANIPITKVTYVYAKWKSNLIKPITVRYVRKDTGEAIADPDSFQAYAGTLKTYHAKTEKQLYDGYQKGWYPTFSSTSITVSKDDSQNIVTFEYEAADKVPYRVEYWIRDENGTERPALKKDGDGYALVGRDETIDTSDMYVAEFPDNTKTVVTENYIKLDKYVPDALQKSLIVSTTGENVIKFIYTYDPTAAYYKVNHYIVNVDVDNPNGPEDCTLYTSSEILGLAGEKYSASPLSSVPGTTFSEDITKNLMGTNTWDGTTKTMTATLAEDNTTELNFYYVRNEYPYTVRYLDAETNQEMQEEAIRASVEYGKEVHETAPVFDGFKVDAASKSLVIKESTAQNVITFYYTRLTGDLKISKALALDPNQKAENSELELPEGSGAVPFKFTVSTKETFYKQSFSYTINRKNGTTENGDVDVKSGSYDKELEPITLFDGDSVVIHDLALGEYTVAEEHVVGYMTTINGRESEKEVVTLDAEGETVTAEVINTYPFFTGDLKLEKTIVAPIGTPSGEGEVFSFTVTMEPEAGTLDLDRVVKYTTLDAGGNAVPQTYTIHKNDYAGSHQITLKLKAGAGPVIVSDVPAGQVIVVETIDEGVYATDYYRVAYDKETGNIEHVVGGGATVDGIIRGGHTTTIGYKNAYRNDGKLTIVKKVTEEVAYDIWKEDTFTFKVTGTTRLPAGSYGIKIDGNDATATVSADGDLTLSKNPDLKITGNDDVTEWSGTVVIEGLPAGIYTVEEIDAGLGLDKYQVTPESKKIENLVLIGNNMSAEAEINNCYNRTEGQMELSKEIVPVVNGAEIDEDQEFTFTITMPADGDFRDKTYKGTKGGSTVDFTVSKDGTFTVTLKHNESITLQNMPIGKYLIEETPVEGYQDTFEITDQNGDLMSDVRVKTGKTTIVKCSNKYPVYVGVLTIDRNNAADSEQVFVYEVKHKGTGETITVTVVGNGQTTIRNLPYGKYTVTQITDWSWRYNHETVHEVELTKEHKEDTVTFAGNASDKWLDGNSPLIRNFWRKKEGD